MSSPTPTAVPLPPRPILISPGWPVDLLDSIVARLRAAQRVQVVGHVRPDGDCIGSLLAMHHLLDQLGVRHALAAQKIPESGYDALVDYALVRETIDPDLNPDLVVFVDCASRERAFGEWQPTAPVINIDHHVSNTLYGELNWIEPRCAATCEMLYHFVMHAGLQLTPPLAEALLVGLATDTGGFRFGNTGPLQFEVAGWLVAAGASPERVGRMAFGSISCNGARLIGHVLHTIKLSCGGALAWTEIRRETYAETGGEGQAPENLADQLRSVRGVRLGLLFHEIEPRTLRANFRSDGSVNVSKLAQEFGGGGHPAAAGLTIETDDYEGQRDAILRRAIETLG